MKKPAPPCSRFVKIGLCGLLLILLVSGCQTAGEQPVASVTPRASQPTQKTPTPHNSVATVSPSATPVATGCDESVGILLEESLDSNLLKEKLEFKVYLPPCYDFDQQQHYSVLYMLHGQTSLNDQWVSLGLLSTMDDLLQKGKIDPFIIVLPSETRSNVDAYVSEFGQVLVDELIPYMGHNFRTCSERQCRAIGGLSRGGNWAIHLGFERPDLFTAVGAHSAPLFYGEIITVRNAASDKEVASSLPVFFIDVGNKDEDFADVQKFVSILQEYHSVEYEFNNFLGYHDDAYWSAHVQDYLLWYNSQLQPPY